MIKREKEAGEKCLNPKNPTIRKFIFRRVARIASYLMVSKAFSMSTLMIILGRVVCQIASYELFPGHGTKSYVDLSFANRSNKNIKIFHMESWEVIRYSIQQGIKDEDRGGGPEIFVEIKKTVLNINVSREDIT